jgi:hypothetical protein
MPRYILGKAAVRAIHSAVDHLFDRAMARFLGRARAPKVVVFTAHQTGIREDRTLPAVFDAHAAAEGFRPNDRLREALAGAVGQYLGAYRELTKARTVGAVQNFLHEAEVKGVKTDLKTVLGGELMNVMAGVTRDVKRLAETEVTRGANLSTLDAITKIATVSGVEDPVVAWIGPSDQHTCKECLRLYFMPDGLTPRCWRLSQATTSHHKHGDEQPSVGGLHPWCRHTMVYVAKGYGFNASGKLEFIADGHDELAKQRDV